MNFINDIANAIPNISVVTKIEVLGFNVPDQYYKILSDFINDVSVSNLNYNVVDSSIDIRKKHKTKLPAAFIDAIGYDLVLISRNFSDFKSIDSLQVIHPRSN